MLKEIWKKELFIYLFNVTLINIYKIRLEGGNKVKGKLLTKLALKKNYWSKSYIIIYFSLVFETTLIL